MLLPEDFVTYTRQKMGEERYDRFLQALDEEPPVSIRLNPLKLRGEPWQVVDGENVPWCSDGYYLPRRPNFTMDPLLHAGCYYVQEASSMFLANVITSILQHFNSPDPQSSLPPLTVLDLCAAPGGKSTLLRTLLPEGSVLYSNEPVRSRASILSENIQKWGWPDCVVTSKYAKDFRKAKMMFDILLCDVPCSGEGMFRKDPLAVKEWSRQNVEHCWRLQRDIVSDIWPCLRPGGMLIYSTCTFNTLENEENVRWLCEQFDAEVLAVPTLPEWHITGSLLPGFDAPVYRFIPGFTRGEGLFMAVLRKKGEYFKPKDACYQRDARNLKSQNSNLKSQINIDLPYPQAIAYLQRQALHLPPDTPRGIVEVSFMGKVLGPCKNIGNRANNLYPQEWRIRTTHTPTEYEPVIIKKEKDNNEL